MAYMTGVPNKTLYSATDSPPDVSCKLKDQVTPFKIALIMVIEEYLKNDRLPIFEREHYSEREEREMLLLLLQLVQSSDLELKQLLYKLCEMNKPRLVEGVRTRLHEIRDEGVCELMNLMNNVSDKLFETETDFQKPLLHRSSVIGLFIRRMVLAFEILTFQEIKKILKSYCAFVDSATKSCESGDNLDITQNDSKFDASMNLVDLDQSDYFTDRHLGDVRHGLNDSHDRLQASQTSAGGPQYSSFGQQSQKQAEYFIAQQSALLQQSEMQALTPKQMQTKISEILTSNPEMAEAYFLNYLNTLRVNEYCQALESLYHYFDRQQVLSVPIRAPVTNSNNRTNQKSDSQEEGTTRGFRYAALNLAALQYRFGHRSEALAATREAVRVAQEANDNVCLQHAMTWLQRLGVKNEGGATEEEGGACTVTSGVESQSGGSVNAAPYLTSLGVQARVQQCALSTMLPRRVFEYIMRSDILNCQHCLPDLLNVSYAQKAALWHMYGNREMCSLNCQLMLHLNASELNIYQNGEAECLALCHMVRLHSEQGDYEAAFEILLCTKLRFPANSKHCQIWMQHEQLLHFWRAMHHGNYKMADQAIHNLASVNALEAKFCRCVLMKDKGETTEASSLLQNLLSRCQATPNRPPPQPHFYARLLITKAELLYSLGQTADAISPLLECITLCDKHHFLQLFATASLHLAFVQYLLGIPKQALRLLESVILTVYAHSSLYDRARALMLWVKCKVACAKHQSETSRQTVLSSCVQTLSDSIGWLQKIEAHRKHKAAIYLQARLYNELGYVSERNRCALKFKELEQLYPSWHCTTVCVL